MPSSSTTTTSSSSNPSPLTGSCLCGTITYTIAQGTASFANVLCYCGNCHKQSGTQQFQSSVFPRAAFALTSATAPKLYVDTDTASGNTLRRHFCGDCGSPIYAVSSGEGARDVLSVAVGSLDRGQAFVRDWAPNMVVCGAQRPGWLEGVRVVEGDRSFERRVREYGVQFSSVGTQEAEAEG